MRLQTVRSYLARKSSSFSLKKVLLIGAIGITIAGLIARNILQLPIQLEKNPIILGHGGMGISSSVPLNSMLSIKQVLSFPIRGTEIDVTMTADEVLMAFHDDELRLETNCTGLISETNLIDLKDCANTTWKNAEDIAQLDRILSQGWKEATVFSLDLKHEKGIENNRITAFAESVTDIILDYPEYKFLIESDQLQLLRSLQLLEVTADLFYYTLDVENGILTATQNELDGISINWKLIHPSQVAAAKEKQLKVMLWGSGSILSNRKCLKMNADIIQTDDVGSMLNLVKL